MAKTPIRRAAKNKMRRSLKASARKNIPRDLAIKAAVHVAVKWLDDDVLRFKQNTPEGIALEAGSDWLLYQVIEPALVGMAKALAVDLAKGKDGVVWGKVKTATRPKKS